MHRIGSLILAVLILMGMFMLAGCKDPVKPPDTPPDVPVSFDVLPNTVVGTFTDPQGVTHDITADRYLAFLSYAVAQMAEVSGKQPVALADPKVWQEPAELPDGTQMSLRETVKAQAKFLLLEAMTVEHWLAETGTSISDSTWEKVKENLGVKRPQGVSVDELAFAIGMIREGVPRLFFEIYKKGGEHEVKDALLRAFFDKYVRSYKWVYIDYAPVGETRLTEAEQIKARKDILRYQELYERYGDFDKVIAFADAGGQGEFADFKKPSGVSYWQDVITADSTSDQAFNKVLDSMAVGEVRVNNVDQYTALVIRLDPEKNRDDGKDIYTDIYDSMITFLLRDDSLHEELGAEFVAQLPPMLAELLGAREDSCSLEMDSTWQMKLDPAIWYQEGAEQ